MAADLGVSIAAKLLETIGSEAIKKVCEMWKYESELENLKETVSTIRGVLLDADAKRELTHQEQDYVNKLKDAVYDADDLFDEIHTLAERSQLMKPLRKRGKLLHKLRRFFSSDNELVKAYRMSGDVRDIKMRLVDIAESHNKFWLNVSDKLIRAREDTCSYVDAKDIIGRDKDKDAIIKMLLNDDVETICCVTIVGVGGLGKTALAQLVYNDEKVKNEFLDLMVWVCVSDQDTTKFDVNVILSKILKQITNKKFDTMQLVQKQLQDQLRGQKYLIVLDDVWNEDHGKWVKLEKFLKFGQGGSRIIVTTRSKRTGTIIDEKYLYNLDGLSIENSWRLFELSAFNEERKHENHDEFVKIGQKIVEKCYNVPLAIKVVGSLLFGQSLNKWQSIKDSGLAQFSEGDKDILSILKLSYHNLAPSLKSCFSYCALFPKDYRLEKEKLISLWMAQGYIMPLDGGQCIEDAAEEHFVILLRRCFFQDVQKNEYEDIEFVKIHDLMHDVAQEVGKEEIRVATTSTNNLGGKIRHVRQVSENLQESLSCSSKFRSLCVWEYQRGLEVSEINNWKRLRVLDLHSSGVVNLPDSIGVLIHLRYLDISNNSDVKALPDAITRLYNLQTLILRSCPIVELPEDFFKLVKLRHLDIGRYYRLNSMPLGMVKLTNLKVLPWFVVGQKVSSEAQRDDEFKPLKALTKIKGGIEIKISKYYRNVEGMDDMEDGYLKGMKHLSKFEIKFEDKEGGWDSQQCERVMETLEPPSNMKVLRMYNYDGTIIPRWGRVVDDWTILFSNLLEVDLRWCRNLKEIPVLSKLRGLRSLFLFGLDNIEYMESGSLSSGVELFFPCLEELYIDGMKRLKGWRKGINYNNYHLLNTAPLIFPRLLDLSIKSCPELTSFPHCPCLERLKLIGSPEGLQIIAGTTGKLRDLRIQNWSYLKSLPINDCLISFVISATDQEGLPEEFQRLAPSLRRLAIVRINNVIRRLFRESGLQQFTALESLQFASVTFGINNEDEDEDGDSSMFWRSIPQNLRTLIISYLTEETRLPKGMQYLTSLQTLRLDNCHKLKRLPDWIHRLSSLQSLIITNCKALESLPESMQKLTSLQSLEIQFCSDDLTNRCRDPDGEYWSYIRHIPHIVLEYSQW